MERIPSRVDGAGDGGTAIKMPMIRWSVLECLFDYGQSFGGGSDRA